MLYWFYLVTVLPFADLVLEIIGFVYPFYVYDGIRLLAPILRQKQCSLLYDVYWLALDVDGIHLLNAERRDAEWPNAQWPYA